MRIMLLLILVVLGKAVGNHLNDIRNGLLFVVAGDSYEDVCRLNSLCFAFDFRTRLISNRFNFLDAYFQPI